MRYPSKEYDQAVEKHQTQIRGNVSSVKMTPEETAAEIAQIVDRAVSSFAEEVKIEAIPEIPGMSKVIWQAKRRGRPKGSKNRPKT